ncbi:MAG TPA: double-strand break repair helicase AddA [Stellaceae bacterium]|nr:double-strand break repair helicase AddA [Stellaceae bacterium]
MIPAPPAILDPNIAQRLAANGRVSAWVAASAGSGKTKVLTDRVLNLLLMGAPPERLLCLTFTKAAAAEMSNRVNDRLSRWAVMPHMELREEIAALQGGYPDDDVYDKARRLFARVLDTPGGMRIMTIHAFCQSVLRRFPLEAGIVPNAEIMDERSAAELLTEAQNAVLVEARANPGSAVAQALAQVTGRVAELGFLDLMNDLASERGRLSQALEAAGGAGAYLVRLHKRLGVSAQETEAHCLAAASDEKAFDGLGLRRAVTVLTGSTKVTDQKRGEALAVWLAADAETRIAGWEAYACAFLTKEGDPTKRLATAEVLKIDPGLVDVLAAEQARVLEVQSRRAAVSAAASSTALLRLADAFLKAYDAQKRLRSLLDYDDLILLTRRLFEQPEIAPWVLFKLDGGIDHILVDEAQDTNPDQWQVIAALADEFFAGMGADPTRERTIFAVGDAKQSIFSFQRADPVKFQEMRDLFHARAAGVEKRLVDVPLTVSFRSAPAILAAVDAVFAQEDARDGVALGGEAAGIVHTPMRRGMAGRVELWPAIRPEDLPELESWAPPLTRRAAEDPSQRLAGLIAGTIRHWLDTGAMLEARARPIRAGDIMVLVRRRNAFARALVRALKARDVAVAGLDRIVLSRQAAVQDLIALGYFLLLPEDDLNLACVLKSPLIGFDEEELFDLAHDRREMSLWRRLAVAAANGEARSAAAHAMLSGLLARADYVAPHALYAELLGPSGARLNLAARLGPEAEDAIDEFLSQSLAYEQAHVPSLQGFLHWMESGMAEVKRDLDQKDRDEVRIMTVHGSKGLQAPIVFLPDTVSTPVKLPVLLWTPDDLLLWAPGVGGRAPLVAQAKNDAAVKRDQEYRRLLYVALTRAEDRLYVCGWETRRKAPTGSWHGLVARALQATGVEVTVAVPPGEADLPEPGWCIETPQHGDVAPKHDGAGFAIAEDLGTALPDFVYRAAPVEPAPPRPLIAAQPSHEEPAPRSPIGAGEDAHRFQRGLLIHRLLQTLPELPLEAAEAAARRFLALPAHGLAPEERAAILVETMAVLRHPEFGPLFAPGSRAEVAVAGLIDGRAFSGRMDRLVVTDTDVMIVDYKTNRPPPRLEHQVAPAYVEQLAAYRAALARIYPDKRIRTLLLWTDGPSLMEIGGAG